MDFYLRTAQVLDRASLAQSSLKAHVAALSLNQGDAKRLLALSVSCLSYKPTLDALVVFARASLLSAPRDWKTIEAAALRASGGGGLKNKATETNSGIKADTLLLVLLHDLLLSPKRTIQASASWPPHALLAKHKTRLRAELTRLQLKAGKTRVEDLRLGGEDRERAERIPRWARVNEGKTSVADVIEGLQQEGWKQVEGSQVAKGRNFLRSPHIPSLLAFHPSSTSTLLAHELYTSGELILQDLASCFPAHILASDYAGKKVEAIDATAAPGNKTSHLSALLGRSASVTAFELSPQRYQTLSSQLHKSGCLADGEDAMVGKKRKRDATAKKDARAGTKNVTALRADFLETDPDDSRWSKVELMLLDPSFFLPEWLLRPTSRKRTNLSRSHQAKQLTMIKHAMRFPSLCRIVYSTCSIHAEEDEHVVLAALASEEAQKGGWGLMGREKVLPGWAVRGKVRECGGDATIANSVIRCVPGGEPARVEGLAPGSVHIEASNGFFVAGFERRLPNDAAGVDQREDDDEDDGDDGDDEDQGNAMGTPCGTSQPAKKRKNKKKKKKKKGKGGAAAAVVSGT
ncbi:hypothetical protein OC842_002547 [Tilletia horrida]|uniref:SAM-dependent MTase RsmB/NOP-type domain-containing protein n=1 Tax=Tilletia horrida TaxID=155126 RepID=A0AAN6GDH4_9BASI|nr:hypothetical protein OC842_002547 [Tilletia horrida]